MLVLNRLVRARFAKIMEKILFIEDEPALQKTLGDVLNKEGYKVVSALDGELGLRMAKTEKPDLILLDLILPKITGFDLLKKFKADPETKKIPVVVLTNLGQMADIEKVLKLGPAAYLIKNNYNLAEVVGKIKKTLKER